MSSARALIKRAYSAVGKAKRDAVARVAASSRACARDRRLLRRALLNTSAARASTRLTDNAWRSTSSMSSVRSSP